MTWQFFATLPDGTIQGEIAGATSNRTCTWRLADAGEAGFNLLGVGDAAPWVRPLASDLLVAFDGQGMWRGRIGPRTRAKDADKQTSTVNAVDYRGVLGRRLTHSPQSYPSTDIAMAGWELITKSQSGEMMAGGDLRITAGQIDTISSRDLTFPAGQPIDEAISKLAGEAPGFDWWIDANLQYQAVRRRGLALRDFVISNDVNATDVAESFDPTTYANVIIQTGADGLMPAVRAVPGLGDRPEGRWETAVSDPDLASQARVDAAADQSLLARSALIPSYTVTLAPNTWTPNDLFVGDHVRLRVDFDDGAPVEITERVSEISVSLDGDGNSTAQIVIGTALREGVAVLLRKLPARLSALNRR